MEIIRLIHALVSDNLQSDLSGTGAVKFYGENPLPAPELEPILNYIEHCRCREMKSLVVGMPVGAFPIAHIHSPDLKIIMQIFVGSRSQFFQEFFHIGDKKRLGLVDNNGHRGMEALDVDYPVFYSGFFYFLLDFLGNIDKIKGSVGLEFDYVVYDFHKVFC